MKSLKIVILSILLPFVGLSQTQTATTYNVNAGNGNGLRFWSSNHYKISMGNTSNYKYGPVQDYSIKMGMYNDNDRGWTWGKYSQAPIAAISAAGKMRLKGDFVTESKIGIGLNSNDPDADIHIYKSSPNVPSIKLEYGTSDGAINWAISGNAVLNFKYMGVDRFSIYNDGSASFYGYLSSPTISGDKVQAKEFVSRTNNFIVKENGFLYARQIEVKATGNFPDYVFDKDYKLRSLDEVESFIKKNHHLPDVPSALEVEENGHNLAEIDEALLRKIEELTLYLIELKKENQALSERIKNLEKVKVED